jgi:hypothetical protein
MVKILNFILHSKAAAQVTGTGIIGISASLAVTDLILKCLIGATTLAFIIYKFRKELKK